MTKVFSCHGYGREVLRLWSCSLHYFSSFDHARSDSAADIPSHVSTCASLDQLTKSDVVELDIVTLRSMLYKWPKVVEGRIMVIMLESC
jgi:hypothetical protein